MGNRRQVLSKYDKTKIFLQKESDLIDRTISSDYLHHFAKIPKYTGQELTNILEDTLPTFFRMSLLENDWETFKKKCVSICGYGYFALSMDLKSSFKSHNNISNRLTDIKNRVYLK